MVNMNGKLPDASKIKLIATDLDGTLLNPNGEISERTSTIIKKVLDKFPNLHFVITSSRERPAIKHIREALGILNRPNTESILLNGCIIYESSGKIIWQNTLPNEFVVKFHNILNSFSNDNYIYSCEDDAVLFNKNLEREAREDFQKKTILVDSHEYNKKVEAGEVKVNKICFLAANEKEGEEINSKVDVLVKKYDLAYAYSNNVFFEYMPHQTNKGTGIIQLIKILNISKDEVMAFGDGDNDLEFFESVGWPVAMGNACDALKPYAQLTTKSNAEDGVADMLERIFLREEQMN
ncbi:hypothetical protein H8356DRAFT_514056 [Neocallimastix lanati (nom. inval.)]|nr:hypothetical protein H8356DRAFT_514056 [Neocallimastix sp. JGI-2020a]